MVDARRLQYLDAMGITVWQRRSLATVPCVEPTVADTDGSRVMDVSAALADVELPADWDQLEQAVRQCTACELHKTRTQTVFGVGNRQADLLIIGEAPGADEDRQGEPFVGRAGQLLNAMLKAIGLQRQQVYIANILKCRPPNNRDPKPEEAAKCVPYLYRQIEMIQPKLILVLGRVAAQRLLKTDTSLAKLRGGIRYEEQTGIPMVVTYHPAYLLRSPKEKRKAWLDLLLAKKMIETGAA